MNLNRKILKNKPLVEAIFEIKWRLEAESDIQFTDKNGLKHPTRVDPHYKLLVGRFYDKIIDNYPYHEPLPASKMPDELSAYIIQHRFRKAENMWPLIQLGPGILTVNDTVDYVWEDFLVKIEKALRILYEIYPKSSENLVINGLMLRYIDIVEFDYAKDFVFDFLKNQFKIEVNLYQKLFEDTNVKKKPMNFDLKFDFQSENPKGLIFLRFSKGYNKVLNQYSILWETVVKSDQEDVSNDLDSIMIWIDKAHELADDWFFKLIEGELEERFK
ncbi:hypothetical protein LCGC14_1138360 [marine sediment metagenome]|uniref:TIGR04255 family protein n=1 Tax=marine sediment metagenome TaxID=412755 RepID=A0A0F9Q4S4_9ZZZZ